MWLGLCDFLKLFDTVEHSALLEALIELSVDEAYIDILKRLHQAQSATVFAGTDSVPFDIGRGVKQCDPLSHCSFCLHYGSNLSEIEQPLDTLESR